MAPRWEDRLRQFVPALLAEHPTLRGVAGDSAAVLHGSTTLGVEDAFSDLDVWLFLPEARLAALRAVERGSFFAFTLAGKEGHLNLESREECARRLDACDLPRIAELRRCRLLTDPNGWAGALVDRARQEMRAPVRRAWFCYHYVEMRSEHRACDNPIERGDAVALLLATTRTLEHAMRAALVLDGEPYPYSKWLARACAATPTGRAVLCLVEDVLDLLATDALRAPGPERQHPLSLKLREIRRVLVEAARAAGIDEPWLAQWWLFLDEARQGIEGVRW
ncbi:MAG: DUF4037 domain-containing protein [Armatimonadetes bacterium]|jgi:hypothetical protein|nr:DUF4037 domain-containing protein [Armatimonadota bacterium]